MQARMITVTFAKETMVIVRIAVLNNNNDIEIHGFVRIANIKMIIANPMVLYNGVIKSFLNLCNNMKLMPRITLLLLFDYGSACCC